MPTIPSLWQAQWKPRKRGLIGSCSMFPQTRTAVETLKAIRPEILVEGEIGDIGSGSEIHDAAPDLRKGLTTPAEAKQLVEETKIDIFAPAVGNMHGMLKSMVAGDTKKRLDIERIRVLSIAANSCISFCPS